MSVLSALRTLLKTPPISAVLFSRQHDLNGERLAQDEVLIAEAGQNLAQPDPPPVFIRGVDV